MVRRIQAPTIEPVTTAELANYLRLESDTQGEEQILLALFITAAREFCEEYTRRSFIKQTWEYIGPPTVDLPRPPVIEKTEELIDDSGFVRIVYEAGYGETPEAVPAPIRNAILQYAAFLYENRGDINAEPPQAVLDLLKPYVVRIL